MAEVWNKADLDDHLKKNNGRLKKPSGDKYKQYIEKALHDLGLPYQKEYQFLVGRKFRFDFAIPSMKLGLEYEGILSEQSRHNNVVGYTNDCNKYNLAIIDGWRVLRYTALNYENVSNDLKKILGR